MVAPLVVYNHAFYRIWLPREISSYGGEAVTVFA